MVVWGGFNFTWKAILPNSQPALIHCTPSSRWVREAGREDGRKRDGGWEAEREVEGSMEGRSEERIAREGGREWTIEKKTGHEKHTMNNTQLAISATHSRCFSDVFSIVRATSQFKITSLEQRKEKKKWQ
jgi:hypothetical protein